MDMQNVSNLQIPEGAVRTIHDKDNRLIWGRLAYDTKYAGDTLQNGTPIPDTPVPVQVVTGEQTVTISDGDTSQTYSISLTGKNLFDKSTVALGKNWNGEIGTTCYPYQTQAIRSVVLVPAKPNTTYNLSLLESDWYVMQVLEADSSYEVLSVYAGQFNQGIKEVTTSATTSYIGIKFKYGSAGTTAMVESLLTELKLQLEVGSPTAYAPYYNYELCKIGDYQDKIFNNDPSEDWYDPDLEDNAWYVHKECGKAVFNGSETWTRQATSTSGKYRFWSTVSDIEQTILAVGYSNMLIPVTEDTYYQDGISGSSSRQAITIRYDSVIGSMDTAQLQAWLANNILISYYKLATPTNTKITDATLVGQLNAVHEWLTRYGYNATVSGNLPLIIDRTNL